VIRGGAAQSARAGTLNKGESANALHRYVALECDVKPLSARHTKIGVLLAEEKPRSKSPAAAGAAMNMAAPVSVALSYDAPVACVAAEPRSCCRISYGQVAGDRQLAGGRQVAGGRQRAGDCAGVLQALTPVNMAPLAAVSAVLSAGWAASES